MKPTLDEDQPLFQQIASMIMDDIVDGKLKAEDQVPSTNELSRYYNINPATARKGLQTLVDKDIIYKQRGLGMFVAKGAKETLLSERKQQFYEEYIVPLLREAKRIHMNEDMIIHLIKTKKEGDSND
ncbi:GntR family transcriptional regulator [Bacillus carboniphilus]|uniref:GntR family transcriptional regulator n=1 Tax=Bacillus carboniphilus TaxID=86663 RepID=A0ABY9JSM8_9BACI|nr:GntR family transcriptional regulator [Bacillus carboniphilus]WLR41819.1 GntR family transcriptional regulator [Bacillus carboniphilus]